MEIAISELRRVANLVFDAVEAEGRATVNLEPSWYWWVPTEQLFASDQPPALTLADVASDWGELQSVGKDTAPVPWHGVAHLAGLLHCLAARLGPDSPG